MADNLKARSRKPEAARKVFIKTFGCQMNVYDSERMIDALAESGYEETAFIEDADLVILNTCHIREKAAEKVYSELGRVRQTRDQRRRMGQDSIIAVAGCVAQAEGEEIVRRSPGVDLVIGPQSYHRLPHLLAEREKTGKSVVETEFLAADKFEKAPARAARMAPAAYLTVQEGCDKFCTFCVVPYTRGAEYSRPVAQVLAEARALADRGVREVTLLGQNVNAYCGRGSDGTLWNLARLLAAVCEISGIDRVRYTTSHPKDMTADLIEAHRDLPKLMPYLHLPLQAGSDRILKAMNRRHTVAEYLDIVARIRDARPDIALSTDIIVGFPGETEGDFEATIRVVEAVRFAQAYSFKYSPRPGTPAAEKADQLDEAAKTRRLAVLQKLLADQQAEFNAATVGRKIEVLWETVGKKTGQIVGRSPYLQSVHAEGGLALLGRITEAEIASAGAHSLRGVIKAAHPSAI